MRQHVCFLTAVLLSLFAAESRAQNFESFSELSGTPAYSYLVLPVSDGYLVATHLIDVFESAYVLYKIDHSGQIQNTLPLYDESEMHVAPQLLTYNGRYFVAGKYSARYLGDNYAEFLDSQRKFLMEVDASLNLLSVQYYDLYQDKSWIWGPVVSQASPVLYVGYPGTHHIANDTLYAAQAYLKVKFEETVDGLQFTELAKEHYFEKLGLEGELYSPGQLLDQVSFFFSSAFTGERLFVFGDVGGTPIGGGGIFDVTALGEYSLNGEPLNTYSYDSGASGLFTTGSTAQYHNGLLYTTYYATSVSGVPGCPDATAAIDIRKPQGFEVVSRFKLPLCEVYTYCKEPFLFNPDGSFYFIGWSPDEADEPVTLFRYGSDLSLQGYVSLHLPGHRPTGIYPAGNNQVLLACEDWSAGNQNSTTLELYLVQTQGLLTSERSVSAPEEFRQFYPNPFVDRIHTAPLPVGQTVEVVGLNGRSFGKYSFANGYANLEHLPEGIYFLRVSDEFGQINQTPTRLLKVAR